MSNVRGTAALVVGISLAAAPTALGVGTQFALADDGGITSRVGAELVTQALAAQGFTVTRSSYATAGQAQAALTAGTIEGYVTDTGTLLERTLGRPAQRNDVALPSVLAAQLTPRGLQVTGTSASDDAQVVACRRQTVKVLKLTGVRNLPTKAPSLIYAATPEHVIRADGLAALRSSFRRVIVKSGSRRFDTIRLRRAQCVQSSGTEPRNGRLGLVVLRDTTRRFAGTPRHVITVATVAYGASAPPTFAPTLDRVAATLTNPTMTSLRAQVELDGKDLPTVARAHLVAAGIVS